MKRRIPPPTPDGLALAADLLAWSRTLEMHGLTWDEWCQERAAIDVELAVSA